MFLSLANPSNKAETEASAGTGFEGNGRVSRGEGGGGGGGGLQGRRTLTFAKQQFVPWTNVTLLRHLVCVSSFFELLPALFLLFFFSFFFSLLFLGLTLPLTTLFSPFVLLPCPRSPPPPPPHLSLSETVFLAEPKLQSL